MPTILKIVLFALVLVAGAYDFRFRRIPNWLCSTGIIAGVGVNLYLFDWHGVIVAVLGSLSALAIYIPLYLARGMGAGDVKLMAAVGSVVGVHDWLGLFL